MMHSMRIELKGSKNNQNVDLFPQCTVARVSVWLHVDLKHLQGLVDNLFWKLSMKRFCHKAILFASF